MVYTQAFDFLVIYVYCVVFTTDKTQQQQYNKVLLMAVHATSDGPAMVAVARNYCGDLYGGNESPASDESC